MALSSMEEYGGNVEEEEEEEEFVVADQVNIIVDEDKVKVYEVGETGADRRKSNMWLRLGYASVEGG